MIEQKLLDKIQELLTTIHQKEDYQYEQIMIKTLVIEDRNRDFQAIQEILEEHGFELRHARNAEEAEQYIATYGLPNFCIVDIHLRTSEKDGIDTAKGLLSKHNFPLVFLTNHYDEQEYSKRVQQLGVPLQCFLPKNLLDNSDVFADRIMNILSDFDYWDSMPVPRIIALQSRKIGISKRGGCDFYSREEILYFEGNGDKTLIHFTDKRPTQSMSGNIGFIAFQVRKVFQNFVMIGSSYCINLEKISYLEGTTLFFESSNKEMASFINLPKDKVSQLKSELHVLRPKKRR